MTAQTSDGLLYQGQSFSLAGEPLYSWLTKRRKQPRFKRRSTACSRGYVASWEIIDERLYLVGIRGRLVDGRSPNLENERDATLAELFPESPDRVFANWFSDELRCPSGRLLGYVHSGYSSVYEFDMFLRFRQGVLIEKQTVTNQPPPLDEFDLLVGDDGIPE